MGQHFYSVEYEDEDGDPVIQHCIMSDAEAAALIDGFARAGVRASANRLSGLQGDPGDVSSTDVGKLLAMGRPDPGVDR